MKKLLLTSAAVLAVFSSAANAADITPYASVKAVMSFTDGTIKGTEDDGTRWKENDKLKNFGGDVAVGAKMGAVRAELAYTYLAKDDKTRRDDSEINKSEISGQSFMLNGYYDIDNPTIFKPYVGAGVGMARRDAADRQRQPCRHGRDKEHVRAVRQRHNAHCLRAQHAAENHAQHKPRSARDGVGAGKHRRLPPDFMLLHPAAPPWPYPMMGR